MDLPWRVSHLTIWFWMLKQAVVISPTEDRSWIALLADSMGAWTTKLGLNSVKAMFGNPLKRGEKAIEETNWAISRFMWM